MRLCSSASSPGVVEGDGMAPGTDAACPSSLGSCRGLETGSGDAAAPNDVLRLGTGSPSAALIAFAKLRQNLADSARCSGSERKPVTA